MAKTKKTAPIPAPAPAPASEPNPARKATPAKASKAVVPAAAAPALKRHKGAARKVVGICRAAMRRMALRAGAKSVRGLVIKQMLDDNREFVGALMRSLLVVRGADSVTITRDIVLEALAMRHPYVKLLA